ncbi:uncharacterized protein CC84DRAFT_517123 [Paraphaeosphaeria sporulosa]|uniref:Uncharacterized protein n=1 Tax=Paraphaeosphaeria sporulosa TaxID=1460663 RepID=A0A177CWC9_9PLEO|nr:uncharacterized protein CC84DRAFT_517123 [Paraphaeosphaeria sporulosa]OAG11039.1 hypothetical protein CC84DRAFT_517123 [Paraphaeosphaeria sporulosa]
MCPNRSRQEPAQIVGLARLFLPQRRAAQTQLTLRAAEHSPSPCLLQTASHALWHAPDVSGRAAATRVRRLGVPQTCWRLPPRRQRMLHFGYARARPCCGSTDSPQPRNTAALLRGFLHLTLYRQCSAVLSSWARELLHMAGTSKYIGLQSAIFDKLVLAVTRQSQETAKIVSNPPATVKLGEPHTPDLRKHS